ncbi:MAG: rod shape-determining protein MreC [Actinomycetota bacterium]
MSTYGRFRSTRLLVVGLLVASLVTITVDARGGDTGPLAAIGRVFGGVVGTLQEGISAVFRPVGNFFSNVFQAGSLAERVQALEAENAALKEQVQATGTETAELEELRRLLDVAEAAEVSVVGASVVGEGGNFEWAVVINKGAQDDVTEDMPVIGPLGLVGHVVSVYETTAKVLLIIDPDSKVSARLTTSRETGLIEGKREEPLEFSLIATETEIVPGEIVETSGYQLDEGYSGIYPPGIPIGVVDKVEPAADGVTLTVTVRPNVNFSSLDKLGLVTGVTNNAEEIQG